MSDRTQNPPEGFTASNGWRVTSRPFGRLGYTDSEGEFREAVKLCHVAPARRFFLEERDHELGRWRDPAHPEIAVYEDTPNVVRTLDEATLIMAEHSRGQSYDIVGAHERAALAYFAAHPVKTVPTVPGLYMRRADVGDIAADLWIGDNGDWVTDVSGKWRTCAVSDLPGDLVRLIPESEVE